MTSPKNSVESAFQLSGSSSPTVIGCDIGGANLKLADSFGRCVARAFPIWLKPHELASELCDMFTEYAITEDTHLAVTMTGELADCFATRRAGVHQILAEVEQAFAPERTQIYAVGNQWLSIDQARMAAWSVAASNWHALATWIGSLPEHPVDLVLDIGSTTVDIIPMRADADGTSSPATSAKTDRDRLELGQLVYTGLERTPVAAIVRDVVLGGRRCPVMAERFATSDDCYLALGLTHESPDDCDTADNCSRTLANAHARLARMIGEDSETLELAAALEIAAQVIDAQASQVAAAITRNLPRSTANITVVGHGRSLATRALAKLTEHVPTVTWLADQLSPAAARCAPALAVANLLASRLLKK
jgi:(4-(4-[2-(gamma-L-glutamylamino)ethyl]phenoxymethyl)furan-2-yl)methanamine synthase